MELPNENLGEEPFAELSTLKLLRTGIGSARAHPRTWLGAFGFLVAIEAVIGLLGEWLDVGPVVVWMRVAVLVGVTGYVIPSVWAYLLDQPLGRQQMKDFIETQMRSLETLGLVIGLIAALSGVGLGLGVVLLSEAWESGRSTLVITVGVLAAVIIFRIALAFFILTPAGLVEHLTFAEAFGRAWRLSGRAWGVLSLLVGIGALIQVAGGYWVATVFGSGGISDWTFAVAIAPVVSSILNLWWILMSGPAYALARERADGYTLRDAARDLDQLLVASDASA